MRYINLKGKKLLLSFRFDHEIIKVVRNLDGREWNAKEKRWEVPVENIDDVIERLKPHGFIVHQDVLAMQKKQEEAQKAIEEIKMGSEPYTGKLPLFDFQKTGASFLKQMPHALLADVPGLGKSIQAMAALEHEKQILIFCPASLKYSWDTEIKKWHPDEWVIVIGGDKQERLEAWTMAMKGIGGRTPKYVIANYELLLHDFEIIKDHDWRAVVCDEATRISNPEAQTTQNLKSLKSAKRIALTGTPISNTPEDIFSIIDWLVPRYLGSFYQFRNKYCVLEDRYQRVIGYQNIDQLKKKVDRFMLRRTKEEVFTDFPPKIVETVHFELSSSEKKLYQSIKEQIHDEIKKLAEFDTRTLGIIPVKMLRLKQCTNHTKLVGDISEGESTKLQTMKELLKPIMASGEKAIIFTQFSEMLNLMLADPELQKYRPLFIYGGVDSVERMIAVKEFNDDPNARIIIMTEAGAYGLNMQSASYVFHYDSPWSIAKLQQREDRAHRIGRNKPVTVYNLVAKNTIDEYVLKVLHKKQKVSTDILMDAERLAEMGMDKEDIDAILRI